MGRKVVLACVAIAGLVGGLLGVTGAQGVQAQALLAPDDCVCSTGLVMDQVTGSRLLNCQCGAMQCVVVTGSGQLQCR